MQPLRFWAAAAALPLLSHGSALFVNVEPSAWLSMPDRLRWSLAADGLLFTAATVIVAAPVAGVAAAAGLANGNPSKLRRVSIIAAAAMLFAAVSSLMTFGWAAGREDAAVFTAQSHITLFAVSLALAAGGALCSAFFRHPLDAAAVGVIASIAAAGGLLLAGATIADAPRALIAVGLMASPLFAIASAATIDIVRMDIPYQISPLAHMQMAYPEWASTSAWYLAAAALACFVFTWKARTRSSVSP